MLTLLLAITTCACILISPWARLPLGAIIKGSTSLFNAIGPMFLALRNMLTSFELYWLPATYHSCMLLVIKTSLHGSKISGSWLNWTFKLTPWPNKHYMFLEQAACPSFLLLFLMCPGLCLLPTCLLHLTLVQLCWNNWAPALPPNTA